MPLDETPPPKGKQYLLALTRLECRTEHSFEELLSHGQLGLRGPAMLERLGDALAILALVASCAWGCRHDDHVPENLARRFHNSARSALRLASLGFYDDALALVRVAAELVNLIQLFALDARAFSVWKGRSDKEKIKTFGAGDVRSKLEARNAIPVADRRLYSKLCEIGVHVSTESAHLSHDLEGHRVYVGSELSVLAFLLVLSELAYLTAHCLPHAVRLAEHREDKIQLASAVQAGLLRLVTWLRVTNYDEVLARFRAKYEK